MTNARAAGGPWLPKDRAGIHHSWLFTHSLVYKPARGRTSSPVWGRPEKPDERNRREPFQGVIAATGEVLLDTHNQQCPLCHP
jgi:hypothetical protein